ncbi:hypothetical protein D9756_006050 [Leucocoprinus leucothites]|uniref:Uncharacterized protein n=1 Tax=Leucocoprinus leucothites TaxID=201217 RepID=A0A8H5D3G7_9AGAR|nr:hypothetical protein D9756_006050 [Leucoagaricus leucothites]
MVAFEELPYDITFKIVESVSSTNASSYQQNLDLNPFHQLKGDTRTLRNLRLVSKSFNHLAVSFLFSDFSFSPSHYGLEKCHAMLSDLSMQKTSVFSSTTSLCLIIGIWWDPKLANLCVKPWFELWDLMLPTMTNLRTVIWSYWLLWSYPIEWVNGSIEALGSLKSLTNLTIFFHNDHPPPALSLVPICGLRRLSIHWCLYRGMTMALRAQISSLLARCPDLQDFAFSVDAHIFSHRKIKPTIALKGLLEGFCRLSIPLKLQRLSTRGVVSCPEDFLVHIRHFRSLEELKVKVDPSPSASDHIGEICAILRREGIHLKALSITALHHPEVIRYISSFNAIECFSLQSLDPLDDHPGSIDSFFSALNQHRQTLKTLKLDVNRKSPWPQALKSHLQKEAGMYKSLRVLCSRVYVTPEEATSNDIWPLHGWLDTVIGLPSLQRLECPYVSYKTGSYYFTRDSNDLINPGGIYSPYTRDLMRQVVCAFMQNRGPKFEIDTRQFT